MAGPSGDSFTGLGIVEGLLGWPYRVEGTPICLNTTTLLAGCVVLDKQLAFKGVLFSISNMEHTSF